ncbi:hypothetical protein TCAL_11284 [Tigriopus californicus]|uniref:Semaphorin-2A n=1 Tax=Tigriopus californicus TaxID=6832 RepID=A0A553NUF6_TIGCA|nr:semaphorin-5B-like [Tigriopus californicus]TRY69068.1 hypothetical protein TCAL_11284 [Tigriopus californicus]|eukprot:TCALIF_11284-PA protein Name:"Similar to Sema5b Semaphorin-5B (Mus musculus)" AED:0.06 eAED:0.06 QI:0/0/0/1/1/1/3/0/1114
MNRQKPPLLVQRNRLLVFLLLVLGFVSDSVQDSAGVGLGQQKCDLSSAVSDYRVVSHEDLLPGLDQFSDEGVRHFSEILFDYRRYQVIVGARDALYRLSLEGLTKLEKATWEAHESTKGICTTKGQTEEDCRNYIKVLVAHNDQVFACGTHAFSPKCSWREIEEINRVSKSIDGRGKCPYSPHANSTSHMTKNGEYYIGSSTDFSSNDHAIYRMSGAQFEKVVRTVQYNALWLMKPDFVGSFETSRFIYFLFRETAVEYGNCGKAIYSRIARVCKSDDGGTLVLKNTWTTFLKARLNCSLPGDYPFYYNEIQSMDYLDEEKIIYATFSTNENSILGSAVCSFKISDVETTFTGRFKTRSGPAAIWESKSDIHSHFECEASDNKHLEVNSREYQLINDAVQPTLPRPLYHENLEQYTHIVVESIATKHQDNYPVHVIFLASRSGGVIKKLSFNTRTSRTCLVEVLHPFASEKRLISISNLKLFAPTNSLYATTEENVLRIPTQRCQRFASKRACLNSMDPYCGWNKLKEECTVTPHKNPRASYWDQNLLTCPILTDPVDGAWGPWSSWETCDYLPSETNDKLRLTNDRRNQQADTCMCKRRDCNQPKPAYGGQKCQGSPLEVTNCTRNGQWTEWSEWSSCSNSCDLGTQQRKRICGNPAPAFGGKTCIGPDLDTRYCSDLPPCAALSHISTASASLVREDVSRWTDWTEWSRCSARCGKGFRSRQRQCFGLQCSGSCSKEFEECESTECSDLLEVTDWTPWIRTNGSAWDGGSWSEKRFRFNYQAPLAINQVGDISEEERICKSTNHCSMLSITQPRKNGLAEVWSEWSKCSRECGTGHQIRIRECPFGQDGCTGQTFAQRACNLQPCQGQWSCWSEWSPCDRDGKRRRSRDCQNHQFGVSSATANDGVTCSGGSSYEEMGCDGWGMWAAWGECDGNGHQTRYRACVASQCSGSDQESKPCGADSIDLARVTTAGAGSVIGACVCGFVLGVFVGAGIVYYVLIHRRGAGGANGSPHYVSAKSQNLYVSLPMLDLRHKHLSSSSNQSDCGTLRSTTTAGTLRSTKTGSIYNGTLNGNKHGDYETATIKRSHSQRNSSLLSSGNHIRADLESDQLFN